MGHFGWWLSTSLLPFHRKVLVLWEAITETPVVTVFGLTEDPDPHRIKIFEQGSEIQHEHDANSQSWDISINRSAPKGPGHFYKLAEILSLLTTDHKKCDRHIYSSEIPQRNLKVVSSTSFESLWKLRICLPEGPLEKLHPETLSTSHLYLMAYYMKNYFYLAAC